MKNKIVSVILLGLFIFLAFKTYNRIIKPIRWGNERLKNYKEVIEQHKEHSESQSHAKSILF